MSVLTRIFSRRFARPYTRGMRHFNRLEFSDAAAEFDRAAAWGNGRGNLDAKLARFYSAEAHAKVGMASYKRGDLARAREEFAHAICVQENYPDLYAYLGILDVREGHLAEARDWLDQALALSPTQREALSARAVVLGRLGEAQAAELDLEHLFHLGLPAPEVLPYQRRLPFTPHCLDDLKAGDERHRCLAIALEHYDRGDWSRAVTVLEGAIGECPGYPDLHHRHGLLLAELLRREEAVSAFDAALVLHPRFVEALLARSLCLLHLGRPEEAVVSLEEAARLKPHYADVAYAQAVAAFHAGRSGEAEVSLVRALTVNPRFWRARLALGLVERALGRRERALEELAAALEHHTPQGPLASWEREHALERDTTPTAMAFWTAAAAGHPDYPDVHFQLGMAELDAGRIDAAREAFRQAVRIHPGYAQAHCGLGKAEIRWGSPIHAIPHLTRALDLDPGLADVWCLLGEARAATGDLSGAAADFERALSLNPVYLDALLGLACVRARQRRVEDARGLYERVLRKAPEHSLARARLAEVGAAT